MPPAASYALSDDGAITFGVDKEFSGFYFPVGKEGSPTLLWGHGNAEDAGHARGLARGLQAQGIGVLIYDYPGYGHSKGQPSEEGTYRSADAAFEYLTVVEKKNGKSIVLLGQSVGGGPSVYLAEKGEAAGLVLISPFKSAFRVVTKVKVLPWDRFDNFKRILNVEIPLLLVHGDSDEVVPFSHGQALFERHKGEKTFLRLEGVGHNDLWPRSSDEVIDAVREFSLKAISS